MEVIVFIFAFLFVIILILVVAGIILSLLANVLGAAAWLTGGILRISDKVCPPSAAGSATVNMQQNKTALSYG